MKPAITVVVPTRHRHALLGEALASIAGQRGVDTGEVEVVVVNDGGGDVGAPVAAARARGLDVRAIELPAHRGLPVARNTGIEAARGRLLAFLDDDDVFLPGHLRTALDALDSGSDLVYTRCLVSPQRLNPTAPIMAALAFDFPFDPGLLGVANTIPVHSAVLRTVRDLPARFDPALPALEDWDFWLRLLRQHSYRFRHIPEATVVYHRIPTQASMTGQTTAEEAALAGFGHLLRHLWRRWPATSARTARFRGYLGIMYWHCFTLFAEGREPEFNYYLRSMHAIADAWTEREPEQALIERLARTVIEEPADAPAAA